MIKSHFHPSNTPPSLKIVKMITESPCNQNLLPPPPWHSPVWWHVRPKYENILAKEMRLEHQSIVEPLMKHFRAMIWKVFLGDASILPNIPNIHQSREDFWMKSDVHTSQGPTCISSWKLWYTKTPILKFFHEYSDISSLFSNLQVRKNEMS